jgi:hypothetical protein
VLKTPEHHRWVLVEVAAPFEMHARKKGKAIEHPPVAVISSRLMLDGTAGA